jgi:hypothetical protein
MTQDEIEGELHRLREQVSNLQQQQERQQKNWRRWGLAFFAIFLMQFTFIGIKIFIYGASAHPGEYDIALTFLFLTLAFTSSDRRFF